MQPLTEMEDSSDEETYCCPCNRQFKRKATYERHMDIAHSSAECHKCHICAKTFGNANTLRMHMNIHQDSKTDAKIERLTRARRNRTPSGGRDRSGDRGSRMKSPNGKRDRSREMPRQTPVKDISKQTPKKLKVDIKEATMVEDVTVRQSIKTEIMSNVCESKDICAGQTPSVLNGKKVSEESVEASSVVIKEEPPSPVDTQSPGCEDSGSLTVSPGAKENVLPLTAVTTTIPTPQPQATSALLSDKVTILQPAAVKANLLQAATESPKVPVTFLLEKDKVRLVDSTNTSRLPLHTSKNGPSTIIIKIEDPEKHCQTSTQVPKSCVSVSQGHSQDVKVTTSAAVAAIKAGPNGIISQPQQTQSPLFVQVAESSRQMSMVSKSLDEDSQETDDEVNIRKSTRLRGKTPGWRTWLEEEEEEDVLSGSKGIRKRRMSQISKVKLEGEDYDIIQQVVDMTSEGFPIDEDSLGLPTTLSSPSDPNLNKRCREVTKTVFACPVCSKEFFSEKYLSMHMSLHRGTGNDVPSPPGTEEAEPPVKKSKPSSNGSGAHWTCKICNKTFAQNSNFKNHIRTHSDERPFVCEICCIGFKERYHLKKHMLFKHSNELKEECRVCGKKFKDSTAVRAHERIHSDVRPYACRRCGKTFKTSECLWHHENRSKTCGVALDGIQAPSSRFRRGRQPRKSTDQPSPPVIKTEVTEVAYITQPGPAIQSMHVVHQPPPPPAPQPPRTQPHSQVQPLPQCHPQQSLLQMHTIPATVASIPTTVQALEQPLHHKPTVQILAQRQSLLQVPAPVVTSQLLQPPAPAQVMMKVQPDSPSPIINTAVDPQLPVVKVEQEIELPDYDLTGLPSDSSMDDSSQDADLHELFASDEETDEIDSPMSLDMDLTDAEQLSPDCDFEDDLKIPTTVTNSDLMSFCCEALEVKADSQGKKRYHCTKCGKQFASPVAFDKHMVTHSEMRPYKCNLCDIGFKLKVHLKKHNLYRHSNEYPCECSICGKKFKDSSAVRLHERIHSTDRPFKCECGKSFKTRENLWGHRHRGPCEKNKDLILQTKLHKGLLPDTEAHGKIGEHMVSAHASIYDNQIIAHAVVSNNKVTAKATIGDNGEVTASALVQGPRISAQVSVNGPEGQAQAQVGDNKVMDSYQAPVLQRETSIPATVVELQTKEDTSTRPIIVSSVPGTQALSLPTAVVAPIKKVMASVPPQVVTSPPAKPAVTTMDKGLPPFETFAPTIMSALQKPPRLPPGVTLPHLAKQQTSLTPCMKSLNETGSIADRCPTIQRYLQQNRPTTTRLPGIQQLFQSHSLAHALKNRNVNNNNSPKSPAKNYATSPMPQLRLPPPGTPPTSSQSSPSPFFTDIHLPPPPPYPGNPNLGGPANADFRCKTPSSVDSAQSMPFMYWDEDSGSDKRPVSVQWQTDADSLFHELANSPAFGQL